MRRIFSPSLKPERIRLNIFMLIFFLTNAFKYFYIFCIFGFYFFIKMDRKITHISGPVSLYVFIVNNKKYLFFGDVHFSNEGSCEDNGIDCDHYDNKFGSVKLHNSDCTDFGALLHNWFTYNNEHNIKTDFYLEVPYTKSDVRHKTSEFIELLEEKTSYFPYANESWISLIADIMYPCFVRDKKGCPYYPNVHAHYADIRVTETSEGLVFHDLFNLAYINNYIYDNIDKMDDIMFELVKQDYWSYLVMLVTNYDTIYGLMIDFDHYQTNMPTLIALSDHIKVPEIKRQYISMLASMEDMTVTRDVFEYQELKMYRIAAEIIKLYDKNPVIAKQLYQFTQSRARILIAFYINSIEKALDKEYTRSEFLDMIAYYDDEFSNITVLHMDTYTLSRMFIQDESSEIIVYTGSHHTLNYVAFFEALHVNPNLIIPENNSPASIRCLYHPQLPRYIDALKYKTYIYFREKALHILNTIDTKDKKYIMTQYGQWYNITVAKNKHPAFKDLYNIYYISDNKQKEISWDKLKTMQLIIKYLTLEASSKTQKMTI